jgi:hypothetical protein
VIRAHYSITIHDGNVVALVGVGQGKTITNDAEYVVNDLREWGFFREVPSFRVIYRDTSGVWDELLVRDGRFDGFQAIGVSERSDALAWLRANPRRGAT